MKRIIRLTWVLLIAASIQINAQDEGETAPNFEVVLLGGDTFNLADHEGKVVMVYFFGNTCPSCRAIGPVIESDIYQEYMDDEGNLVAVGIDTWNSSSNESSVAGFKNTTGITFPLAIKGGDVAVTYKTTYDRLMVIDRAGNLVHKGLVLASNDIDNTIAAIEESLKVTGLEAQISDRPSVYPNPAKDVLHVSAGTDLVSGFTLFDLSGRKVMESVSFAGQALSEFQVDLQKFESGVYIYKLETEEESVTGRVVIQK